MASMIPTMIDRISSWDREGEGRSVRASKEPVLQEHGSRRADGEPLWRKGGSGPRREKAASRPLLSQDQRPVMFVALAGRVGAREADARRLLHEQVAVVGRRGRPARDRLADRVGPGRQVLGRGPAD